MRIIDWSSDVCSSDLRRIVAPARQQSVERFGLDHRAGQDVRADGARLLDHADRQLRVELLEADRQRQPRGTRAHGDDVVFHDVALDFRSAVARRSEEHTSELQSLMRTSYAVLSLT